VKSVEGLICVNGIDVDGAVQSSKLNVKNVKIWFGKMLNGAFGAVHLC